MSIEFITGEDRYRVERALHTARERWRDPLLGALGQTVLHEPGPMEAAEALATMTLAFGTGLPLVELHGGWWLDRAGQSKSEDSQLEQLQEALTRCADSKNILIVCPKPNGRLKLVKWLMTQSGANVLSFDIPPPWKSDDVVRTLIEEAKLAGYTLRPQAARMLVESYGHPLMPLMSEVAKLATYTRNQPIEPSHVEALCHSSERLNVLLERWLQQASPVDERMKYLADLLLTLHPVQIMLSLQGQLELAHQLKYQTQVLRQPVEALAKTLGKNPYFLKKQLEPLARVSLERLHRLRHKALQAEHDLKTGGLEATLSLERLLCL